jgi:CRP-like cAMP-binding protein
MQAADSHILYEYGCEILDCYFVSTALISCLQVMRNGDTVEVGLFGAEGFAGHPALLNFTHSTQLVTVQVPGEVIKIDSGVLRRFLPQTPVLEKLLLRFSYLQSLQAQQIAACNGLHEIEQRLALWILMTQDRVRLETLPLTHDLLAGMLGSRRASVTVAAGALQKAGMIEYHRGKLQVLQRQKLEQAACECYGALRSQLNSYVQSIDLYRPYAL